MKYKYWAIATFGIFVPVMLFVAGVIAYTQKGNIMTFKQLLNETAHLGLKGTEGVAGTNCYGDSCLGFVTIMLFFVWMPCFLIVAFLLALFVGIPVGLAYLAALGTRNAKLKDVLPIRLSH